MGTDWVGEAEAGAVDGSEGWARWELHVDVGSGAGAGVGEG
jgi:hypothetical protein